MTLIDQDDLGFDWDDGNSSKNWKKHGVAMEECEEVFSNVPYLVRGDFKHSDKEERLGILGITDKGRFLSIAYTMRRGKICVIMARDMSKKERKDYEQYA